MSVAERVRQSLLWPMLWKEFVQMRRDRMTLGLMLAIPAMQLVLFGFAIRTEVRDVPTVVLDEARSSESRALAAVLENTGNFRLVGSVDGRDALRAEIESGRAQAALVIPPDYTEDVKRGRTASAQVIVDAADPMSSSAALSGAALAAQARSQALSGRRAAPPPPLEVRVRPWYNPALRSEVYIVPGLIGVLLTLTMILITSLSITRERERGTLEQLVVTPIDRTSMMLGKIIPFVLVGYVQMTLVLLLGRFLFGVPVRGSMLALYGITFAFMMASLGLGLFVSTVARTQAQAMQLGFMLLLPNILLSGFMFPREAMPAPIRWASALLPLTHYLQVLRGVLLRDAALPSLLPDAAVLLLMAAVIVGLSVSRFSKTID
ncbi:MAG TPA: ABC transporter permease [Longimicrobiaceae bacterium]|nr:ABC transporter permease [Longimicrobiaceae bacterium]